MGTNKVQPESTRAVTTEQPFDNVCAGSDQHFFAVQPGIDACAAFEEAECNIATAEALMGEIISLSARPVELAHAARLLIQSARALYTAAATGESVSRVVGEQR